MTHTDAPAAALSVSRIEDFPTTVRYHLADAPIVEEDGKRYRADFVDINKMRGDIGVHHIRLTKTGAPFKQVASHSRWTWAYPSRDGKIINEEMGGPIVEFILAYTAEPVEGEIREIRAPGHTWDRRIVRVEDPGGSVGIHRVSPITSVGGWRFSEPEVVTKLDAWFAAHQLVRVTAPVKGHIMSLRAGDTLIAVEGDQGPTGDAGLLVEQVSPDDANPNDLIVTVWFEGEMVTEVLNGHNDADFRREA